MLVLWSEDLRLISSYHSYALVIIIKL